MKALLVPALVAATGCAPRATVTPERAASDLCDGDRAWPLVVDGGRMFVDATLDGVGAAPVRLLVDTGGNAIGVVLFRSSADRIGVADARALQGSLSVAGRSFSLPAGAQWAIVDDLDSGSLPRRARPHESDGQIGAGFLSRFRVCVDPVARRLGLGDATAAPIASTAPALPLDLAEEAPFGARFAFVRMQAGQSSLSLLVDTGASAGMLHAREHAALRAFAPGAELASGDWDMVAGDEPFERVVVAPSLARAAIELGPAAFVSRADGTFPSLFTALPGGGPDGVIGNDVWLRHRILLDYASARLFVWPLQPPGEFPARVPITVSFDRDECPTVARVAAETRREGLAPKDIIERVDGRGACGLSHAAVSEMLTRPAGARVTLGVRRGIDARDIVVTSQPLLTPSANDATSR